MGIFLLVAPALGLVQYAARPAIIARAPGPSMGFFDQLAAAFDNDDDLGDDGRFKAKYQTITWKGPKPEGAAAMFGAKQAVQEQQVVQGQKLKDVAQTAGIPIRYSCMQGTCHLCDVMVDGETLPACTAICPSRDCTIEYRDVDQAADYAKEMLKAEREAKRAGKAAVSGKVAPTKQPGFTPPANPFAAAFQEAEAEEEEERLSSHHRRQRSAQWLQVEAQSATEGGAGLSDEDDDELEAAALAEEEAMLEAEERALAVAEAALRRAASEQANEEASEQAVGEEKVEGSEEDEDDEEGEGQESEEGDGEQEEGAFFVPATREEEKQGGEPGALDDDDDDDLDDAGPRRAWADVAVRPTKNF